IGGSEISSPHSFPVGVTTVDVTVSDIHNNTNTCMFTVTVNDTELPAPNCPAPITTNTTGSCSQTVSFAASPTDNCGVSNTVYKIGGSAITSPHSFPVGVTTVDVTVNDIHNNTNTCSFMVTVNDTELPVPNCPAHIVTNTTSSCSQTVSFSASPTDNCGLR